MKILVVTAHPDDVDFGAGGTIRKWILEGHHVVYCLVTDGQAGGTDNTITRDDMAAIRRREQTLAAAVLGVTELHFLGFPDGAVVADLELRREISAVIRRVQPDRVLTQSPERRYDRIYASHPDHLATGEATMCAVYPDARNEFAFPELLSERGLAPHSVSETWIMGGPHPRHFEDVSATIDAKFDALMCHASQHHDAAAMGERVMQWSATVAEAGGLPAGSLAEAFLIVDTK
jgi:LmbE family N-acetylglucosaminyl deacetylase